MPDPQEVIWWCYLGFGVICAFKFTKFILLFVDIAKKPVGQPAYARKRPQTSNADPTPTPRVVIIGAGPAGIATAGALNHLGIDNIVIEKSDQAANSWRGHYKRLHLHTINQFSSLPHVPFPPHYPLFVPRQQFADYVASYASMMQVKINYRETVNEVTEPKGATKTWSVATTKKDGTSASVVVCTGENIVPLIPTYPDQNLFKGTILHSSKYFSAEAYRGKKVLVVGFGNTGGELAIDLHEHDCNVHIIARSPVNIIKRQTLILAPTIARYLPVWLQLALQWLIIRMDYGDMHKYGITCPISSGFKDLAYHRLRDHHEAPVVDIGQIDLIRKGILKVHKAEVSKFTPTGVIFKDGKEEPFDVVILATGFKPNLDQILSNQVYNAAIVAGKGYPKPLETVSKELPGLYFVGFRDEVGRILKMREDAIEVADSIKKLLH